MSVPKAKQTKYRPVLTAAQITKILALAKLEQPISAESFSLISTLSPFAAKIANGGIQAAYVTVPPKAKATSLEGLGADLAKFTDLVNLSSKCEPGIDKEAYWYDCYRKYNSDPVSCSLEEIQAAKEHMYLNDLMSEEEIAEFEAPHVDGNNSLL